MNRITLAGTDIEVSRLAFGTARIHHLSSRHQRQELLGAAFDIGITHFDTAPSYGFGLAEEELGRFVKSRGACISLASKVGLYPPEGAASSAIGIQLQKALGKIWPELTRPIVDWSMARAAQSFETSLRRIRRDYLDILFLHEPAPALLDSDEFQRWLEDLRRQGRIRGYGVAGDVGPFMPWIASRHPVAMIVQTRDSVAGKEADSLIEAGRALQFTYGYFSGSSGGGGAKPAATVLPQALARNGGGSVLVSSRRVDRLAEYARVVERHGGWQ